MPTRPDTIAAAEKRARALELRKAGATFAQIAEQVGYANKGTAHRAVMIGIGELTREPAEGPSPLSCPGLTR